MLQRILPPVFLLIAVVLFAAAGYAYYYLDDAPGATIDEPDREFPALAVGHNETTLRLHNPTRHTVRVVGYQFC